MKIKGTKSVNKSPKKEIKDVREVLRSSTTRDDIKSIKIVTNNNSLFLHPEYIDSNNICRQAAKINRFDSAKELPDTKLRQDVSTTQTHLPKIRNPSRDMCVPTNIMAKQFQNPNEYAFYVMCS